MKFTAEIAKDVANKKLTVVRQFAAPVEKVWRAWTEPEILDKWWAPLPWKTETKSMDFTPGGLWLYSMVGPEGERHYCRVDFKTIAAGSAFTSQATFCDELGNINTSFPVMYWDVRFSSSHAGTQVDVTISFDKEADMQQIIQMGFETGFSMAMGNLDELLEA